MAEAGDRRPRDLALAATHYRTAAEHGHTGGENPAGSRAADWPRHPAQPGGGRDLAAPRRAGRRRRRRRRYSGDFHASPERDPANLEEAAHWYRHAAELGHPGSAHVLARAISAGAEGAPDPQEIAAGWKPRSSAATPRPGPIWAELIASLSLPPDQLPVLHGWLQRMIREDRPEAGYYVGICVNCGIGTPADERLARRYYLWAAGEGVIEAMVAAAEMLLNGRGGPADPDCRARCSHTPRSRIMPGRVMRSGRDGGAAIGTARWGISGGRRSWGTRRRRLLVARGVEVV